MALNVALIRQSFQAVSYKSERITEIFYDTLFSRYPEVRPLFVNTRMDEQRKKLFRALALIVRNLENPEYLGAYLHGLGLMHVAYGAETEHYDAVGESLLHALAQVAGPLWNDELNAVWTEAYAAIASMMKEGASKAEASAQA